MLSPSGINHLMLLRGLHAILLGLSSTQLLCFLELQLPLLLISRFTSSTLEVIETEVNTISPEHHQNP